MPARAKGLDLPAGVQRVHARSCPAVVSDDLAVCVCRPRYQAQAGPRRGRKTRTHATLAAAKTWKRDTDRAYERGEIRAGRAPTLREASEAWLTAAEAGVALARGDRRYKPSTLRGYRRSMLADLYPAFGGRALDKLERRELGEFVMSLAAKGRSASTVRNVIIPLRALYRHAIYLEQVTTNPTVGLKVPAGSGRRLNVLTRDEIPATLAALDVSDRALWATAIYAGLRRGELMGLRWADVDLGAGVIIVAQSYDPGSRSMQDAKSAAGQDRRVPIGAALRDYLTEHRQRAGARPSGLVFRRGSLAHRRLIAGDEDRPFADQAVGQRATRRWATANVRPVGLHDCRHTFASLMIAAMAAAGTFNPKSLQAMLGHKSIQQTYDRYGHLFPGAEVEAVRMLDAFLDTTRSEIEIVAERLVALLESAGDDALPEVARVRDQLDAWLAGRGSGGVLPSGAPVGDRVCERPVSVQSAEIRVVSEPGR